MAEQVGDHSGASFFVDKEASEQEGNGDPTRLIPTLAVQLMQKVPGMASELSRIADGIRPGKEVQDLILDLMAHAKFGTRSSASLLIVIDHLDEFGSELKSEDMSERFEALLAKLSQTHGTILRIVVTCRPDKKVWLLTFTTLRWETRQPKSLEATS